MPYNDFCTHNPAVTFMHKINHNSSSGADKSKKLKKHKKTTTNNKQTKKKNKVPCLLQQLV